MKNSSALIIDSYAFLVYFNQEAGADDVEQIFEKAQQDQLYLFMSIINWGEIYYSICRERGKEAAEEAIVLINQLPITLIDVDRNLVYQAAQFKSQYALSYADCFAAALAQRESCPVLTGDKEFQKFHTEIQIKWL